MATTTKNTLAADNQARSNPKVALSLDKQLYSDMINDAYNNSLKDIGPFRATILSVKARFLVDESSGTRVTTVVDGYKPANYYEVMVRPEWVSATPAPWDFSDFQLTNTDIIQGEMALNAVAAHFEARSVSPSGNGQSILLAIGDVVVCTFGEGMDNNGKARDIRFELNSVGRDNDLIIAAGGIGALQASRGKSGNIIGSLSQTSGSNNTTGFLYPGKRGMNVREANRKPGDIKLIVLHGSQGPSGPGRARGLINWFHTGPAGTYKWTSPSGDVIQNPPCEDVLRSGAGLPDKTICKNGKVRTNRNTSIHYCVDGGGEVVQGAAEKDIAQHSGGTRNKISIGIEMVGFPQNGPGKGSGGIYSEMYNDELLNATAKLCAGICKRWNLQPTRQVLIGHEDFNPKGKIGPGATIGITKKGKEYGKDTGNYWNWKDFLERTKRFYDAL